MKRRVAKRPVRWHGSRRYRQPWSGSVLGLFYYCPVVNHFSKSLFFPCFPRFYAGYTTDFFGSLAEFLTNPPYRSEETPVHALLRLGVNVVSGPENLGHVPFLSASRTSRNWRW